jgi:hypothetical protein
MTAGRGTALAGSCTQHEHSGGIGAPPGTTKSPCQELADVLMLRYRPLAYLSAASNPESAARCWTDAAIGAPRGARRVRQRARNHRFALFGAPSLRVRMRGIRQSPDASRIPAAIAHGSLT